jgi:glycosyltransferase involved in cell wall biosynthesis
MGAVSLDFPPSQRFKCVPRPPHPEWTPGGPVLLSVVMPCYNEQATLREIATQVLAQPFDLELLIIDDGSHDDTHKVALQLATEHPDRVRLLAQPGNQGKGAALRRGFAEALGDVVLVQDADLEYDPCDYGKLLEPILAGRADVVYGSRFAGPARTPRTLHTLGNRLLTNLSNVATGLHLTDMETCYKAFRRQVVQSLRLEENRFGIEPELTAKVAAVPGVRICEVPIGYRGRTYAQGKKIGLKDAFRAVYAITKYGVLTRVRR